jgi:hypothetical protein
MRLQGVKDRVDMPREVVGVEQERDLTLARLDARDLFRRRG